MLVDLLSSYTRYSVSLVDSAGTVAATRQAAQRTPLSDAHGHAIVLPYVSTTSDTLYYLDGDSTVDFWRLDGSAGTAARLDVGPWMEATFAVSPDDTRMAVSVLDFHRSPVHVTLYTVSLLAGDKHVIFESDSDYVWPVAWHLGLLVLAHAYGPYEEDIAAAAPGRDNPYSAVSYHVVDPLTAERRVLMGSCTVSGSLSPAGSGCIQGGSIDWQGNTSPWSTHDWGSVSSAASLSPSGQWMAATSPDNPNAMAIWRTNGNVIDYVNGPGGRDWAGWLDDHVIVTGSYTDPNWQPEVVNVNSGRGGLEHFVTGVHGFFAAVLPTNVD